MCEEGIVIFVVVDFFSKLNFKYSIEFLETQMSPFVQLIQKLVEQLCEVGTYLLIEQFIFVTEVRIKLLLLHLCGLRIVLGLQREHVIYGCHAERLHDPRCEERSKYGEHLLRSVLFYDALKLPRKVKCRSQLLQLCLVYDIVRYVLQLHGAAYQTSVLDDGPLEFKLKLAYLLHDLHVALTHVIIARLGDSFVHQGFVLGKELLLVSEPFADGLHIILVLLRALEHVDGQKIYYLILLADQPVHLTVDPAHDLDTATEVLSNDHLFQKKLLHVDLALVLDLLGIQIEFDSIRCYKIQDLAIHYMAVYQLHSARLALFFSRIIEREFKCPSIVLDLVKYIHYQVSSVILRDLHIEVTVE